MLPSSNGDQLSDLEDRARAQFGPLSDAEIKLLRTAPKGEIAHCGPSERDDDPNNNPVHSDNWDSERSIRAELIRWLCVDREARDRVDPRGLQVHAARINGKLDLAFAAVPFFLGLFRCSLSDEVELRSMEIPAMDLRGTSLPSLDAEYATIKGSISVRGLYLKGTLQLRGARIGGNLDCVAGKFQNPAIAGVATSGIAIEASNAKVTGHVFLGAGFFAEGLVRLASCEIGGILACNGGTFHNAAREGIAGTGVALTAEGATIAGGVQLAHNFAAEGMVRLFGAQIGGNLSCSEGKFKNPARADVAGTGVALTAEGAKVAGSVLLGNSFTAKGMVRLLGTQIGGNLSCDGGALQNPAKANIAESGMALTAEGANVAGSVWLRDGFAAEGTVRLSGAQIGGSLECSGGKFQNPARAGVAGAGMALTAEGAKVAGSVLLRDGFAAEGTVRLYSAEIEGNLECESGKFDGLDLTNASAGAILDDENSWPEPGKLFLDGFVYGRISYGPVTATKRLAWLARQESFTRPPYRQLAKILKEAGDDQGSRRVCVEMERRAWKARGWVVQPISYVLEGTIGYGYFSIRALWWLLALVILGSVVYWRGDEARNMVPTEKDAYDSFVTPKGLPAYYEPFHALPYSLENSFPVVKLGVQEKWVPRSDEQGITGQSANWASRFLLCIASPRFLRRFKWFQICAGWILATLLVAGISGVVRQD